MKYSLQNLAQSLSDASCTGEVEFNGVSTDSRAIQHGNLFFALRGDQFDAHNFLQQVAQSGAAAVVVEHLPENYPLPAIVVNDTRRALIECAQVWRKQFSIPVIGVTGSNGKTTVKEMIASILRTAYGDENILATQANLNNEIGVPLTLFRLNPHHRAAVIEMGMNHPGEIALLTQAAQPTIALVNNAQREHQEFMHTVAAVAQENGTVIRCLSADGAAVFPADSEFSSLWAAYAKDQSVSRVYTFGLLNETQHADFAANVHPHALGSDVELHALGQVYRYQLKIAGQHNVLNSLAALACTYAAGVTIETILRGLEAFEPVKGRLQSKRASNGAHLIDDTYNANPDSVRAAIDVLSGQVGDRILVLGDMGEVGQDGPAYHAEIGAYAKDKGLKTIYLLGDLTQHAVAASDGIAKHFSSMDELLHALNGCVTPASTVLVKGSRFMKMERVIAHLQNS